MKHAKKKAPDRFTPGGWQVMFKRQVVDASKRVLMECADPYSQDTNEANMRLASASPELLEALMAFVEAAEQLGAPPHPFHFEMAHKAIAKATGSNL